MAPGWCIDVPSDEKSLETIRTYANPNCAFCRGSGIEEIKESLDPNYANDNARLVLKALGYSSLLGSADIHDFQRACIRGLATSNHKTRENYDGRGPARAVKGRIEPGCSIISTGLDEAGLLLRVQQLLEYTVAAQTRGAKTILWG